MKTIAYWEKLREKAHEELSRLSLPGFRRPILRGRSRKTRLILWARYLRERDEAHRIEAKSRSLERRLVFYETRIQALRSRTAFDRLRVGEPQVGP